MKKTLLLILFFPIVSFAETVEIDGVFYNLIEKGNIAEVTSGPNGYSGDIVIQESVSHNNKNYSVVSIGEKVFYNASITSIYIPPSIKEIKWEAFGYNEYLKSVRISDLESWLKISFSVNPLYDAKHLFINDIEVTDIVIPESISEIKENVFFGFSSLKSVIIPSSVVSIGYNSFRYCTSLKNISIPHSVISVGEGAFSYCSDLESVSLPNDLKYISRDLFYGCSSLKSIKIPASVESIKDNAFMDCNNLESIELPDNLKEIGRQAFEECRKLRLISFGKYIRQISTSCFKNCIELKNVYCNADKVPYVEGNVFEGSYIEYAVLHVPELLIDNYKAAEVWKDFKEIVALKSDDPNPASIKSIMNDDKSNNNLYDLNGRKLVSEPIGKGVYIYNGKKVIK